MIRKLPKQRKWKLYSKAGKNLGTFKTKALAEARERQIQFFKVRQKWQKRR